MKLFINRNWDTTLMVVSGLLLVLLLAIVIQIWLDPSGPGSTFIELALNICLSVMFLASLGLYVLSVYDRILFYRLLALLYARLADGDTLIFKVLSSDREIHIQRLSSEFIIDDDALRSQRTVIYVKPTSITFRNETTQSIPEFKEIDGQTEFVGISEIHRSVPLPVSNHARYMRDLTGLLSEID